MKILINLIFMLFASLSLMAQGTPSPQIKFESNVFSYGKIKEVDGEATATFKFKNISDKPYIIKYISVNCGCTTPQYKRAPIMPNETSEITVRYNPAGRSGAFSSSLYVVEGSGEYVNTLEIKGNIEPRPKSVEDVYPVMLSDGIRAESMIATYKQVPVGYAHNLMIGVYNSSEKPVEFKTKVDNKTGRFIAYMSPAVLKPKEKGQLFVVYDLKKEPKVYGNFSTTVDLTINGVPYKENFIINGISIPDFTSYTSEMIQKSPVGELSSRFYHFGNVKQSQKLTRSFSIINSGVNNLEILEISKSSDKVTYTIDKKVIKTGETANITATLLPSSSDSGRITENIIFVTNDQSQPIKELRLVANIQ